MYREDRKLEPLEDSFALEDEEGGDKSNFFSSLNITEPSYLANRSVVDHMRELHWKNAHFARSVQDSWKNGKHYAFCTGHGRRRIHLDVNIDTTLHIQTKTCYIYASVP